MKIYFAIGSNTKLKGDEVNALQSTGAQQVLYSYAVVGGREDIPMPFKDIILDSGAFSVASNNTMKVTLGGYSMWLQLYLSKYPQIKAYVNLDDVEVIDKKFNNLWNLAKSMK